MKQPLDLSSNVIARVLPQPDLTAEQRKIAVSSLRKLLSAIQIELPFVYVEKDGKRSYTLSAKRGAVVVAVVVTTEIPK